MPTNNTTQKIMDWTLTPHSQVAGEIREMADKEGTSKGQSLVMKGLAHGIEFAGNRATNMATNGINFGASIAVSTILHFANQSEKIISNYASGLSEKQSEKLYEEYGEFTAGTYGELRGNGGFWTKARDIGETIVDKVSDVAIGSEIFSDAKHMAKKFVEMKKAGGSVDEIEKMSKLAKDNGQDFDFNEYMDFKKSGGKFEDYKKLTEANKKLPDGDKVTLDEHLDIKKAGGDVTKFTDLAKSSADKGKEFDVGDYKEFLKKAGTGPERAAREKELSNVISKGGDPSEYVDVMHKPDKREAFLKQSEQPKAPDKGKKVAEVGSQDQPQTSPENIDKQKLEGLASSLQSGMRSTNISGTNPDALREAGGGHGAPNASGPATRTTQLT